MALVAAGLSTAPAASAATNPFQRGPDPTTASVEAPTGPFAISQTTVARGNGFGGGTVYFPTDTSQGTFGAVAIAPGFTESQSAISWFGPRLASQGFVVFTIDTNSGFDNPDTRATELLAALDFLTGTASPVRTRIDASRLAVMGHSMGGGGTLAAANRRPALQAAIPLAPWHTTKSFSGVQVPTLIVAAQNDNIAPVSQHAMPFYNSLPTTLQKAYLELRGAGHTVTNSPNTTVARLSISWLKRFVDNDTRFDQFLCPAPATSSVISQYLSTCPYTAGLAGAA
jgi:alpha-beta hydrolase superfamily lysophospholipase